jgi:soluble lytic murein transglycosylase
MNRTAFPLLLFLTLCAPLPGLSAERSNASEIRAEFERSYEAATRKQATTDSAALQTYILYPYLQQQRLLNLLNADVSAETDRAIESFLATHGTATVTRDLRRAWLANLATRQQWERYLANYRETDDLALRCHALSARLALQRTENVQTGAIALWSIAADSQPACEPAFTWLRAQAALTPELIEKRARLALRAANPSFARQMIAMLPQDAQAVLIAWAELIERPRAAIDAAIAQPDKAIDPEALLDGWTRFARSDQGGAMQRYRTIVTARKLDSATASRFALELALALSWSRRPEALQYFARVRSTEFDDRAHEWHARAALWAEDWKLVRKVVAAMPETLSKQTRWRYWAARAAEVQGERATAKAQYNALLTDDNYYAALAAARLETRYTPQQQSLSADEPQLLTLAQEPGFIRARELLQTNSNALRSYAYEEWRAAYTKLSVEARKQAIVLATRWGWYDQAVTIAAQQGVFNDYALFYPRPFDEAVAAGAQRASVPPSLIYATLRQESLYRTDALSTAGAKGVMQLLPETARGVARRWRLNEKGDLFDPEVNISLGAAKLREMIDRFGGQTALALAAYNAGPNTIPRWSPTETTELDIWIENIPYNETRTYVQRVYWHSLVFNWLATKEPQETKHWLTKVEPPSP